MIAKFIQYCDILSGKEVEFRKFAVKNYIPGIEELGFMQIVGNWYVAAGEGPYFILEGMAPSVKAINQMLSEPEFRKLNQLMHFLTTNYKTKVLAPLDGQAPAKVPETRNCRFNHHYEVISDRLEEFQRFQAEEHLPGLEKLGVKVIGTWSVVLGPGPGVVVEGSCPGTEQILQALGSEKYRLLNRRLQTMVTCLGSKILVPAGLI